MLQYSFCISENSDSLGLSLQDNTGVYSVNNKSGYGAPNSLLSDVLTSTLTVTFPNPAIAPLTINVFDTLLPYPNTLNIVKNIANTTLGLTSLKMLDDGVYLFAGIQTGTSGGVPFTTTFSAYKILDNQVQAFFDQKTLALTVPDCSCACPSEDSYQLERLKNLLRAAKAAACNGQLTNATAIMNYLIKITNCNGPLTLC